MSIITTTPFTPRKDYQDPILSTITHKAEISPSDVLDITETFSKHHAKITSQCHKALKVYKKMLTVKYQLNSWEFLTLKTSIDLSFNDDPITQNGTSASCATTPTTTTTPITTPIATPTPGGAGTRKFDIRIANSCIDKCSKLDNELNFIDTNITMLKGFISVLTIEEYISDPGCLILSIYFKLLQLKTTLNETLSIAYTKAKLIIILYELTQILNKLNSEECPLVRENTDYQSTLNSYKNFIKNIINQLDSAIEQKDSEQIQECLNILHDVEKMYESVRLNFEIMNEDLYDYGDFYSDMSSPKTLQYEDDYIYSKVPNSSNRSRRTSISSTTSSLRHGFMGGKTTLTEEMPFLLQAFDEAKQLEQELSEYQQQSSTPINTPYTNTHTPSSSTSTASYLHSSTTLPRVTSPLASNSLTPTSPTSSSNIMTPQSHSHTHPHSHSLSLSQMSSMSTMSSISSKPGASSITSSGSILSKVKFPSQDKRNLTMPLQPNNLTAGFTGSSVGFSNSLLNSIYGLHPTNGGKNGFKNVLSPHSEVD